MEMNNDELVALLMELCQQPAESQWLEFKVNAIANGGIGEYISAISNGATLSNKSFGYFVLGVENETHAVKGTAFTFNKAKQGNQDLELWLRNLLSPKINFEIYEFKCEKKHIVLLRIPSAKGEPVNFNGQAFVRIGSNKTSLNKYPDFMRIIYNSQEDWSARIAEKASLADLDAQALKVARKKFKEKNAGASFFDDINDWDDALFLDKAQITLDGKITNTALILLGKGESTHYFSPAIAEITWKLDTQEKAYEHFSPPFLLTTTKVMERIRNVQYKFFPDNSMLSTTVNKYDSRSILEALNNCIAHQDYLLNSRIIVTENIDKLMFSNAGIFFEGRPNEYSMGNKTPEKYRNTRLVNAMVSLGMIDRLGYGIHSLFMSQRNRFFPLPDYEISQTGGVILTIYGKDIDENYSKTLIQRSDLSLQQVLLLDRVQKKLEIKDAEAAMLRKEKLIEGRKPNYFIGAAIAKITEQKAQYSKNKAFDKQYYLDLVLKAIKEHGSINRKDVDGLLWTKLPEWMNDKQRKIRIMHLIA
ncbi:MAG: putative DNA binding domain-containing protein, partial [Endomicrobium sp.]|nr:putative DNA binding domain-containing protein [Endomicrobium sp.]